MICPLPDKLLRFSIQQHEGCIVFTEQDSVFGCRCKMVWERRCGCWWVSIDSGPYMDGNRALYADLAKQHELIVSVYGDNFEQKGGEHEP